MAGGILGPSDYAPWLRTPESWTNTQASFNLGAQIAQNRVNNALKEKEFQLDAQRSMLQTQEYFSKKEIQNRMMSGTSDLAQTMAGFTDMTDPAIPEKIYGVLAQNPTVEPIAKQFLDLHERAKEFKQKADELKTYHQGLLDVRAQDITAKAQTEADRLRLGEIRSEIASRRADSTIGVNDVRIQKLQAEADAIQAKTENIGETTQTKNLSAADRFDEQADAADAIDPDYADRLRANADLLRGSLNRAGKATTGPNAFSPQEKQLGNVKLIQVSPQRWTVVDKPMNTGRMAQADIEEVRDLRHQRDAITIGNEPKPPVKPSKDEQTAYDARLARYRKSVADVGALQARIDGLLNKYRSADTNAAPQKFNFNPKTGKLEPVQ